MSKYDDFDLDIKNTQLNNDYDVNALGGALDSKLACDFTKWLSEKIVESYIDGCLSNDCSDNCSRGPCTSMNSVIVEK